MLLKRLEKYLFPIGLLIVTLYFIPYIILGESSVVAFHDQLDGEVPVYLLHAKYLFSGIDAYQELMNGIPSIGLTPPAPLAVLLYRLFSPFTAYAITQFVTMMTAYVGMSLCTKALGHNPINRFFVSGLFSFLTVPSVYGLSILGQPFLFWCFYQLTPYSKKLRCPWLPLIGIAFYTGFSSFVLSGFALVGVALAISLFILIKHLRNSLKPFLWFFTGVAVLIALYITFNLNLIGQMVGITGNFVSHREETVVYGIPFLSNTWQIFTTGIQHTGDSHIWILAFATVLLIYGLLIKQTRSFHYRLMAFLYLFILVLSIGSGLIAMPSVVAFRNQAGGFLKYFQFNRVIWLTPACWYLILSLALHLTFLTFREKSHTLIKRVSNIIIATFAVVTVCATGFLLLYTNLLRQNIKQIVLPDSPHSMTWEQFYAIDLFDQAKQILPDNYSDYRVVSLGLYPAAALYNGFYCLDGYSNNYPLTYKHEFRTIIAPELAKNEELRLYYDNWGNRCYFYSAEIGNYCLVKKDAGLSIKHLDDNTTQLKEMGAKYLFSALPLENTTDKYRLLNPVPFRSEDSYYQLYVYEIL
jgi:hypothetical protein